MSGIATVTAAMYAGIRGLTPKTAGVEFPYTILEEADGRVTPLEQRQWSGQHRQVDIRVLGMPRDDGEAGLTSRRLRVRLGIRVQYDLRGDRAETERWAVEDVGQLVLELPRPSLYTGAGVAAVVFDEEPTTEIDEDEGWARAIVACTAIYQESTS